MKKYKHALTGAIYAVDGQTNAIRVEQDGHVGFFTPQGRWLSGDITEADPHMCAWVGGPGHDDKLTKPYKSGLDSGQ